MSSRISEALDSLDQDVAGLRLAPPEAIRARGESRRRQQLIGGGVAIAVVATALTTVVVLPVVHGGAPVQQPLGFGDSSGPASVSASCSPVPNPTHAPPADGTSRTAKVWLKSTATPAETAAVGTQLRSLSTAALGPGQLVTSVTFESRQQAYERFKAQFCNAPDLIAATKPETLPESYTITLANPTDFAAVYTLIEGMAGVEDVVRVPQ